MTAPRKPATHNHGSLKIKLLGKDNAPLSIPELHQGLYEIARYLAPFEGPYRAKYATLFLSMINEDGTAVRLEPSGEITIFPYRSIAEDFKD